MVLTTEEQLLVRQAAARLQEEFEGKLAAETIEGLVGDSLDRLMETAETTTGIALLTERFTRDRLRAAVRHRDGPALSKPGVLFLCVHNAGRSQMAAAFMRHLSGGRVEVFTGGSEPASEVNRTAVAAMTEKGIDIRERMPQPWSDEIVRAADVVVTMGCGDACPFFPGKRYLDWEVDDPSGMTLEEVRPIRDDLESRVRGLLADLHIEPVW